MKTLDEHGNGIGVFLSSQPLSHYLNTSIQRSVAGGIAAGLAKTMTAPLERVRIIKQASMRGAASASQLMSQIYESDGLRGLWRGNAVNLSRVIPSYAVRFTVFGNLTDYADRYKLLGNPFVVGSLSGTASALASYPLEVLRTRISVSGSLRDAWIKGRLLAGSSLTIIEAAPYAGLTLGTYNYLKTNYPAADLWGHVAHGFLAGSVGTLLCFPLDTLRRNRIMRPDHPISIIAADLYREGKLTRYYRGIAIALVKSAPTVALTMIFNDLFLHGLGVS